MNEANPELAENNEENASTAAAESADAEAAAELVVVEEMEAAEELDLAALEDELLMIDETAAQEEHAEAAELILGMHDEAEATEASLMEVGELAEEITATREELKPVIEALLFVSEEPLSLKQLGKVLGEVPEIEVQVALEELVKDYDERQGGLEIREVAGGWRISTRPQHHDFIRKYLKSRPTAKLSLPALETLAVIAYKQPITIPEILEIRGVSSSSAIKTLLEKRLIVTKGRKETVGRPMMYGTSKDFLLQFGLRDLTELPSIEDFEDLGQ
jgi:segregation and condensation protein B